MLLITRGMGHEDRIKLVSHAIRKTRGIFSINKIRIFQEVESVESNF